MMVGMYELHGWGVPNIQHQCVYKDLHMNTYLREHHPSCPVLCHPEDMAGHGGLAISPWNIHCPNKWDEQCSRGGPFLPGLQHVRNAKQ